MLSSRSQTSPAAARVHTLGPLWEWRFEVGQTAITVRLRSGTAERDGTELALNRPYTLANVRSKVMTWRGCEIEVSGACDEYVAEQGPETPVVSYWNLHLLLTALRADAEQNGGSGGGGGGGGSAASTGPRVLVAGPPNSGRTTLVRTLAAWATRMGGRQACVVNADPGEGLLTLPGTLSAAVFGTLMDVESESGWGGAPSNGPAAVPVKLPLALLLPAARRPTTTRPCSAPWPAASPAPSPPAWPTTRPSAPPACSSTRRPLAPSRPRRASTC